MNAKLEEFKKITEELSTLYVEKNEEYGDSFGEMYKKSGLAPCLYQVEHKLNRAMQIADKDDVKFESLDDTLRDLANYAIMTYLEYRLSLSKKVEPSRSESGSDGLNFDELIKSFLNEHETHDSSSVYLYTSSEKKEEPEESEFEKLKKELVDIFASASDELSGKEKEAFDEILKPLNKANNFKEFFSCLSAVIMLDEFQEYLKEVSVEDKLFCDMMVVYGPLLGNIMDNEMLSDGEM